jgi:periplasmic divalent cation tolerance protein
MEHLLVITTCPNQQCADDLADILVRSHLAACVNQIPGIRSVYEWKGQVTTDQEFLLLIKTRADTYDRVEETIRARHPYEVPEVIALPIARGSADYLSWINSLLEAKK